ncbi:legumain-like [Brevipalpus obovatus]|uniref:legumain-like n=1 Tax=Brevipalpus obovatus TaxID=246614 RepID=UPI003D9F9F4F
MSIGDMPLSAFQGSVNPPSKPNPYQKCDILMESREVPLYLMKQRVARASPMERPGLQKKLDHMIEGREFLRRSVRDVVKYLCSIGHCNFSEEMLDQRKGRITQHECVEKLIRTFSSKCFKVAKHPYTIKYLSSLVNIAEGLPTEDIDKECSRVALHLDSACEMLLPAHNFERID